MRDIQLDSDYDLLISNGDLVIDDATYQHQAILLKASPGEIKQFPTTGVGADAFLLDEDKSLFLREIRSQFTKDGMRVEKVYLAPDGTLTINADYQ
jgi:hypothetical protein